MVWPVILWQFSLLVKFSDYNSAVILAGEQMASILGGISWKLPSIVVKLPWGLKLMKLCELKERKLFISNMTEGEMISDQGFLLCILFLY